MKIHVPKALRQEITDCQARLAEEIKTDAEQRIALAEKISGYEADETNLAGEIESLNEQILHNAKAANKIPPLELRLNAVRLELQRLRTALEDARPVSLAFVQPVLRAIIAHWQSTFPDAFADYTALVFSTRQNALNVSKLSDAYRFTLVIAARSYNHVATDGMVEFFNAVMRRALLGQAHLGIDVPNGGAA